MQISPEADHVLSMFAKLRTKKICVVGDFIVDYYRIVNTKGVSPEAPVLIVKPEKEEFLPGGAGNVVANLKAFNIGTPSLITVLGHKNRDLVDKTALPEMRSWVEEFDRSTTVKERIVTRRQQLMRIDHQPGGPIKLETAHAVLERSLTKQLIEEADAIIFSDYDHGVCIPDLVCPILRRAIERGIPTIVDSKAMDTTQKYKGATIALPNMDEARRMTRMDDFSDDEVARYILKSMKLKAAAITLGPKGILLMTLDGSQIYPPLHQDTEKEVTDVTGAGDTVAATVAAGLATGMSLDEIMKLANIAAGIKVQKRGVATVSEQEIIHTMMD